ncbi:MAG: hypothetical protein IJY42_05495 [Clostridia bacterium]|nr:hypothetical protein [Clostridia bacterium]
MTQTMHGSVGTEEENNQKLLRETDQYLRGYALNRKLLRLDRYEREFFKQRETEAGEPFGEGVLARARMFEIRHFVMSMDNSDEKLFLYYHYIKGQSVERCGELLGLSRSSAFRMKKRALLLAGRHRNSLETT